MPDNHAEMQMQEPTPSQETQFDDIDFNDGEGGFEDEKEEKIDVEKNGEIDDIFSKLDTEKQAAVIKYAKSMVNDKENDDEVEETDEDEEMVNEIANNILDDISKKSSETKDKKIRNTKITNDNPFVAKRFSN